MSEKNIKEGNQKGELVDIRKIKIDMSLTKEDRVKSYISQIKDPYHFLFDNITVTVNFDDSGKRLEEIIYDYIMSIPKQ